MVAGAVGVTAAMAGEESGTSGQSVVCPQVLITNTPAAAEAQVDRELALLVTQIEEANARLANSAGEGGPNFVQNAILGPLEDKRVAVLDRIGQVFERQGETAPANLDALAACSLSDGVGAAPEESAAPVEDAGVEAGSIACPEVVVGAVPAAEAEVDRELALLQTQIGEANARLVSSAGEGGANFVQNAILGPLEDKRVASLDRIRIAFERQGEVAPAGLQALATCSLSDGGEAPADPAPEVPAEDTGAEAGSIACPEVVVGAVPAAAEAEVDRELALLQTQIGEANARLVSSAGEGGPDFVQNAILGPLEDKRVASLDRIRIAIERQGEVAPAGLQALATCSLG
ncbi:hypothetical protein GCM10022245_65170 [Streptomyces mayteni]